MPTNSDPPKIVEILGPDQVVQGSFVELKWKLSGGAPSQILVNGKLVSGSSAKIRVEADPTPFTLTVHNPAGSDSRQKLIGAHHPQHAVSGHTNCHVRGDIELLLLDAVGKPVAKEAFVAILEDGSRVEGASDATGTVKLRNVIAGPFEISFPECSGAVTLGEPAPAEAT